MSDRRQPRAPRVGSGCEGGGRVSLVMLEAPRVSDGTGRGSIALADNRSVVASAMPPHPVGENLRYCVTEWVRRAEGDRSSALTDAVGSDPCPLKGLVPMHGSMALSVLFPRLAMLACENLYRRRRA